MSSPNQPENETARLAELHDLQILDTAAEQAYDDITLLASQICGTPVALMTLIDADRQWFKSKQGTDVSETGRDIAFCAHAILNPYEMLIVPDMNEDDRFVENPLVTGDEHVRSYAGVPLTTEAGNALGTLCVIDRIPHELTAAQREGLQALSRQVMAQLELRRHVAALQKRAEERDIYREELEESQRQLEEQMKIVAERSITDPLTGLRNRRPVVERMREEVERAKRHGTSFALAMIDIDQFKSFNDSYGHQAGDVALQQVAAVLTRESRANDLVARWGGEEFTVVMANTDRQGATTYGERLRRAVEVAVWPVAPLTVSVGVASVAGPDADVDAMMMAADEALYRAKADGRNTVVTAD